MKLKKIAFVFSALLSMQVSNAAPDSKKEFFAHLNKLCGATYEGSATVMSPDSQKIFEGKKLVAKIASCTADEIRVPFIVGEDQSRTWIFKQSANSLTLAHDHRHSDGTPDAQTMYGGLASAAGTKDAQYFHADEYTAKLIPAAATNIWLVAISPDGSKLTYALDRSGNPRVKVELFRKN